MRGFFGFVATAFWRSLGQTCVSAFLLVLGVSPETIAERFDLPPALLGEWWFPYVLVVPAVLIIAWIFYRQSQYERVRPLPFNIPISDLINYLRSRSTWGINENPLLPLRDMSVLVEINQKVRDGTIELQGRREHAASQQAFDGRWLLTWEPVTRKYPDYWDHMQVSRYAIVSCSLPEAETEPISVSVTTSYPRFTQLRAAWPQIPIVWPKANILQQVLKRIRLWRV